MAIQFMNGKILFVGGKIAMDSDCCDCAPCEHCSGGSGPPEYDAHLVFTSPSSILDLVIENWVNNCGNPIGSGPCCWQGISGGISVAVSYVGGWKAGIEVAGGFPCQDVDSGGSFSCINGGTFDPFGKGWTLTLTPKWGCE